MAEIVRPGQEEELARVVNGGIAEAAAAGGRVVDRDTARRIAAAIHRGLGGELERFAATGEIRHHHVARLELFYSLKDEPRFTAWRTALREFINHDARSGRPAATGQGAGLGGARQRRRSEPGSTLPKANPEVGGCAPCDPEGVVAYVCHDPGDQAERDGLALQMQHQACRHFTRHQLRKRLDATFMDNAKTRRAGLKRLLAHLAVCHNRRVVVERLDRLPPGGGAAGQVAKTGARVLSASEQSPRSRRRQAAFGQDVAELASQPDRPGGEGRS
ncbi:MAG: hypothetical protein LBU05_01060 [Bifidobacteriaceae bacterium]|jgi:hypothetical protein|nr:hypothetical protein [Bifidobacteriaceae bacterium]